MQPSTPADPNGPVVIKRVQGSSRVDTAIAVARENFKAPTKVVLADGRDFVDAIAAAPAAAALEAPLLLTVNASLEKGVLDLLNEWNVKEVVIAGGPKSVSDAKVAALQAKGITTTRAAGNDRFTTAVELAKVAERANGKVARIFVADGINFPDASSASAVAGRHDGVVLLTNGKTMPQSTATFLDRHQAAPVVAVGGAATRALASDGYIAGATMEVLSGASRYETAALAAKKYAADARVVFVATGTVAADALAVGGAVAQRDGALLLTEPLRLPKAASDDLKSRVAVLEEVQIVGGTQSVSTAVERVLRHLVKR